MSDGGLNGANEASTTDNLVSARKSLHRSFVVPAEEALNKREEKVTLD